MTALLLAGIAPAWFNFLDLNRLHEETGLPTLSISFEPSHGLTATIHEQFDGDARDWRLGRYESLPPRRSLTVNEQQLFVRAVGADSAAGAAAVDEPVPPLEPNCEAAQIVRGFTPEGGRPEPLRVARVAARAGRELNERLGEE